MHYKKLVSEKQPVTLTNKFSLLTKIFFIYFELLVHVFDKSTEKQDYKRTIQKTIKFYGTNDFVSKNYHHKPKITSQNKTSRHNNFLH